MSKNEPFAPWQCPLCGEKLTGDSTLKCTKGHCFDRAKEGYWHKDGWPVLVKRAMECDFSWSNSAKSYEGLYNEVVNLW